MVGDMSLSFVSSARRRHGGLASAALFHPLVEAATALSEQLRGDRPLPAA